MSTSASTARSDEADESSSDSPSADKSSSKQSSSEQSSSEQHSQQQPAATPLTPAHSPSPYSPAAEMAAARPAGDTPADELVDPSAMPRDRSRALTIIICILLTHVLYMGRTLLMPVAMGIVIAFLLRPIVRRLEHLRIPPVAGAGIVLIAVVAGLAAGFAQLATPASEWIAREPLEFRVRQLQRKLRPVQEPISQINEVSRKLEEMAAESSEQDIETRPKAESVEIRQPSVTSTLMSTTGSALAQTAICLVLAYFLLSMGDVFLNQVLHLIPSMRDKKEAVLLVRNVERGISSYLLTVTLINAALGTCIGLGLWLLGLPNPGLWGVMAFLLNYIPYAGAMVGSAVVFFVGLITFESLGQAALAPVIYFTLNAIEGNFITPTLLGRSMNLNPIIVFLALTFWGWMWGIGGALLAVPLLAIFKVVCDQFERTRPISVLISS